MTHQGTIILETKRLVLRPATPADAMAVYVGWGSDPRVTRHLGWEPHPDLQHTRAQLEQTMTGYSQPDFYYWMITLAATGELMGCITVKPSKHGDLLEPAYWLGFRYWSGGYMAEALGAVSGYMLEKIRVDCLICCHDVENPASGRVMEKVGFRYAYDRECTRKDGSSRPCHCYLLEKELGRP